MKRLFLLLISCVACLAHLSGQTFDVVQGDVTWRYDANSLTAPMAFHAGTLAVGSAEHSLSGTTMRVDPSGKYEPLTVSVVYSGNAAKVVADGALASSLTCTVDGPRVSIVAASSLLEEVTYRLSGEGENFTLAGEYKATVELAGVSLKAAGEVPALYIANGKRIDIRCVDGTVNNFEDASSNLLKSAFYVKGHAEWKGGGTVNIRGNARHAYSSNDYTDIKASFTGTLNILGAKSDGMHIDQYFIMNGGTVNVQNVEGDGIDVGYKLEDDDVTPTNDSLNGQAHIKNGVLNVTVATVDTKALKSVYDMVITGGSLDIRANADGTRGLNSGNNLTIGTKGATDNAVPYILLTAKGGTFTDELGDTHKCRGIKVKNNFYFYSGTVKRSLDSSVSADKMVDVDGMPYVSGGKFDGITL